MILLNTAFNGGKTGSLTKSSLRNNVVTVMAKYSLLVVHSPLLSMYSPVWHSHITIPDTDVTVLMLSGHAQA